MSLSIFTLFAAGVGTFFTPCVLPLIPIYLGILMGSQKDEMGRAQRLFPALAFIFGFSLVFVLLGLGASVIGALMIQYKLLFTIIAGILILGFGLKFLGIVQIGFLNRDTRMQGDVSKTRFLTVNAFLMGFFFAFGWTPCVGPILGSVLTWTAANAQSSWQGGLYLSVFSAGFAVPMLLAALFTSQTQSLFNKIKPKLPVIEKALGAIMVVVALTVIIGVVSPMLAQQDTASQEKASDAAPVQSDMDTKSNISKRPVMVEFYSPTCHACKTVAPIVHKIQQNCEGQSVEIKLLNVQDAGNRMKAIQSGVRAIPTFVFYDSTGTEAARLLGVQTEKTLRNHLSALMGEECPDIGQFPPKG